MELQESIEIPKNVLRGYSDAFWRAMFVQVESYYLKSRLGTGSEPQKKNCMQGVTAIIGVLDGLESEGVILSNPEFRGAIDSVHENIVNEWLKLNRLPKTR